MKKILLLLFLVAILNSSGLLASDDIEVVIFNNSDKLLKCQRNDGKGYVPFIRAMPNERKEFKSFKKASNVRCSTSLDRDSGTFLTYFSINQAGLYELLQEMVPCEKCQNGSETRWATIVVYPNGESFYTKW